MKNPIAQYVQFVRNIERAKREGRTGELLKAAKENAELQKIMMRPRQYTVTNGAGEIGWGTAWLFLALSSYVSVSLPASPWRGRVGIFFLLCGCVAMPICLWASKKFIIQPRIGYVAFRRGKSWWIGMIIGMVVAAGVSIALSLWLIPEMIHVAPSSAYHAAAATTVSVHDTPSRSDKLLIAGCGLMNAILYLMFNAVSIKEHRWKWVCFVMILVVPPIIGHLHPGNYLQMSPPVMLFQGSVYFLSGVITLIWFLRRHQPIAPEAE
jgi:hypothetical protein